jgi:hypothetical protein
MDDQQNGIEKRFTLGRHRHDSSQPTNLPNFKATLSSRFDSKMKQIYGNYKLRPRRAVTFLKESKPSYPLRARSNSDSYFKNTWNYSQTNELEPEEVEDGHSPQPITPHLPEEKEPLVHIPEDVDKEIKLYDQVSDEKEDVLYEYKDENEILVGATKERLVRIITSASNAVGTYD